MQARKPVRRIALDIKQGVADFGITMQKQAAQGRVVAEFTDIIGVNESNLMAKVTIDFELFKVQYKDGVATLGDKLAQSVCLHSVKVIEAEVSHDGGITSEVVDYQLDKEDMHVLSMALAKAIESYPNLPAKPIIAPDRTDLGNAGVEDPCKIELGNGDDYDFVCRLSTSAEGELTVYMDGVAKTKAVFDASFEERCSPAKYVGRELVEARVDGLVNIVINNLDIGGDINEGGRHKGVEKELYQYAPSKLERKAIERIITDSIKHF